MTNKRKRSASDGGADVLVYGMPEPVSDTLEGGMDTFLKTRPQSRITRKLPVSGEPHGLNETKKAGNR